MNKQIGQVYRVHSNKYFVCVDNKIVQCNARGILKIKSDSILVGDYVELENNTIINVKDRKNRFRRPNVTNVDIVVAVTSPQPKPDYLLIDKLYINAVKEDVDFCIIVNKSDTDNKLFDEIRSEYKDLDIKIISVSATTGDGIEELKKLLKGKFAVLAGQSAVGKTSITNTIFSLNLKVGDVSKKIERGKHTTTHSDIFELDNIKIIDSPGFAVIDANVDLEQLPQCYPEYFEVSNECKYRTCSHINEPNCKVKQLVEQGEFSKNRYERYKEIYNEILSRRINYDKN